MKEEKDILKKHITSNFKQETPSMDFTELVMKKVENSLETKTLAAPLISKKVWIYAGAIAAIVILISFGAEVQQSNSNWLGDFGIELPNLKKFKTTITLSIIMVAVLLLMTVADLLHRSRKQFG